MKKILSFVLALMMALLYLGVQAEEPEIYVIEDGVLVAYNGQDGDPVVIPEGVTKIADEVFAFRYFPSVTLPSTLTSIGDGAFFNGGGSFDLTIPATVTHIGYGAFRNNDIRLTVDPANTHYKTVDYVLFNKAGTEILGYPNWKKDEHYDIPEGVVKIAKLGMGNARFRTVSIPSSVRKIEEEAFYVSYLTEVTIPATVKYVNLSAFAYNNNLQKIVFQYKKTSVDGWYDRSSGACRTTVYAAKYSRAHKYLLETSGLDLDFEEIPDESGEPDDIWGIKLNKQELKLKAGKTATLKATLEPSSADKKAIKWVSSNKKVATVSKSGKVTAVGKGTCVISCKSTDGTEIIASCKVTVTQPVTKIRLSKASVTLKVKKTVKLKATVYPEKASNKKVKWTSSNKKVAKVSNDGVVTAVGKGTCVITCTAQDGSGVKATCKITVK